MARKRRSAKKSSTSKGKRSTKVRRRTWDPVEVAEKLAPSVAVMLGLDVLGLDEDQTIELLRDLLVQIIGDRVTKPKAETLVNAILRNQNKAFMVIAAKLLEIVPEGKLTPEQLEFVANYIGALSIPFMPRLFKEAKRLNMNINSALQAAWETAWRERGELGPVGYCPKCGFRSVAPDATCMVCGHILSDKELREATDFESKLNAFLQEASCKELEEALKENRLYVDHSSVNLTPTNKWAIEILLSRKEREKIREVVSNKCKKIEEAKSLHEVLSEIASKLE